MMVPISSANGIRQFWGVEVWKFCMAGIMQVNDNVETAERV